MTTGQLGETHSTKCTIDPQRLRSRLEPFDLLGVLEYPYAFHLVANGHPTIFFFCTCQWTKLTNGDESHATNLRLIGRRLLKPYIQYDPSYLPMQRGDWLTEFHLCLGID